LTCCDFTSVFKTCFSRFISVSCHYWLHALHITQKLSNCCRHYCDQSISRIIKSDFCRLRPLCSANKCMRNLARGHSASVKF
jgi:hypothetical protein